MGITKALQRAAAVGLFLSLGPVCLSAAAPSKTLRGWLSDQGCARGRATSGVYTGTNPDCAKRCVNQGSKIVLIVPDEKAILEITNQESARNHVGDFVEISGTVDAHAGSLSIDSLKLLEHGKAMCGLPKHKK